MKNIIRNICIFQITFSKWIAPLRKNCFLVILEKNFNSLSHPIHVFWKNILYLTRKHYFSGKIFAVLHQNKRKISSLVEQWEKSSHLLSKTFLSLILMDSPIVHWYQYIVLIKALQCIDASHQYCDQFNISCSRCNFICWSLELSLSDWGKNKLLAFLILGQKGTGASLRFKTKTSEYQSFRVCPFIAGPPFGSSSSYFCSTFQWL